MSVQISEVPRFNASVPKPLFDVQVFLAGRNYAAASDGQLFLVNRISQESLEAPITVMFNWTAALTKK